MLAFREAPTKKGTAAMTQAPPTISSLRAKACVALLALLGFSLGVSEFVPIGVESELAAHYGVSLSEAGCSISIFALFTPS